MPHYHHCPGHCHLSPVTTATFAPRESDTGARPCKADVSLYCSHPPNRLSFIQSEGRGFQGPSPSSHLPHHLLISSPVTLSSHRGLVAFSQSCGFCADCSLSGTLFSQIPTQLSPSPPSDLYSNVTLLMTPTPTISFQIGPLPALSVLVTFIYWSTGLIPSD